MRRCLAALASLLFLAGCAFPGSVQVRAFTTGFKAGDTIRYRVHVTLTGALRMGAQQLPLSSDQTLTQVFHVQSVDSSGTATLELTTQDVVGGTGGANTLAPPVVTLRIEPDGRIVSGAAAQIGGRIPSLPGSDQLGPVLPDHSVKPGDSWDKAYTRPNPYGSGQFSLTSHNTYLKDEAVGGVTASAIETRLQGPIDFTIDFAKLPGVASLPPGAVVGGVVHYTGSIDSTWRYWISLTDHQVLRSNGTSSYQISYAMTALAGQAGGPQQIDLNGQIKSDVMRI